MVIISKITDTSIKAAKNYIMCAEHYPINFRTTTSKFSLLICNDFEVMDFELVLTEILYLNFSTKYMF